MPGLVVILSEPGQPELATLLEQMLAPLTYPNYQTARVILPEMGVAVGHTGPQRLAAPQPGQDAAGQVLVVLEGMPSEMPQHAAQLGLPADTSPAAVIAALVARQGHQALEKLDGHWAAAVVDLRSRQVIIACDPFGVRGLYQMRGDDGAWLIASHPAALLAYPAARRELDPAGLADFLAFGHAIGEKTLFAGMTALPGATLLRWADGQMSRRRYWLPVIRPARTFSEKDLEAIRQRFNHNVASAMASGQPCSMALSGGGDSRAVLSAMLAAGGRPHAVTHAIPGATDAELSAQVAQRADLPHHFYPVQGEELVGQVMPGIRLLAGRVAGIDIHPLCFLDDIATYTRTMFTGLAGNLYRAHEFVVESPDRFSSLPALADYITMAYNRLIPVDELPALLAPDWYQPAGDQPRRSVLAALEDAAGQAADIAHRSVLFYLQERTCKFLTKGDAIVRREIETRHPFLDREFCTRAWELPHFVCRQGLLHSYIITHNAPELTTLPFSFTLPDGLPLRTYPRGRLQRLTTRVSQYWQIARIRLGMAPPEVGNYRYREWLRGPLRPLLMDVLLDPRTAGRPYLRHETVRRWLDEHMAGRDHTAKLGALLSLELTVRLLIEGGW
jgi:hypothetical protein